MAKKTAKKYEMKRDDIREALDSIQDRLTDIDTANESPNGVADILQELADDIDDLKSQIFDEV